MHLVLGMAKMMHQSNSDGRHTNTNEVHHRHYQCGRNGARKACTDGVVTRHVWHDIIIVCVKAGGPEKCNKLLHKWRFRELAFGSLTMLQLK